MNAEKDKLVIAVPRGSLFEGSLKLLADLGIATDIVREQDRRLYFPEIGVLTVRPTDVPTYIEAGAADLGITGKDVLAEHSEHHVCELADLGFGPCKMVVALKADHDYLAQALEDFGVVRIATKYPRLAAAHFHRSGRQAEIIEVKGSVELAPLAGLADAIVDLVATGTTLRENGLVEREHLFDSSARLIANPVSYRLKAKAIDGMLQQVHKWLEKKVNES